MLWPRLSALATAALVASTACTPAAPGAAVAVSQPASHAVDKRAATTTPSSTARTAPTGATTSATTGAGKSTRVPAAASITPTPWSSTVTAPPAATTFALNGEQAREVATVVQFVDAYNSGDVAGALALFADSPKVWFSACRYRTGETIDGTGKTAIKSWLAEAAAEHSRLVLGSIEDANPDRPIGGVGMQLTRQTSDTIRKLGYPGGIIPASGTEIIFDRGGKILRFASGSFGGPQSMCQLPQR